jgi:NADH-quinone oxidoreductase subunit M
MNGILSITVLSPLLGVAGILLLRAFSRPDDPRLNEAVRWIALASTLATLALSVLMLAQFHPRQSGFQFVEDLNWFSGVHYRMGVDGISILFVLLTAFLLPFCIVASWKSITNRVVEYMVAFLMLEGMVLGVFCALDLIVFYLYFEFQLLPMFLIIGIWGGKNRLYAAFKFFLYTLLGSVLMLAAILSMVVIAHTSSIPALLAYKF